MNTTRMMRSERDDDGRINGGIGVIEKTKQERKLEIPKMWSVFILNDDFTPIGVVVDVLSLVFSVSASEAERKAAIAHRTGRCIMGTFSKDVAEMKVRQVPDETRKHGDFPLQAEMQEAPSA